MNSEENEIMRDVYRYLNTHADPPAPTDPSAVEWWIRACDDMNEIMNKHKQHSLAVRLLSEVYWYLEEKGKKKNERTQE